MAEEIVEKVAQAIEGAKEGHSIRLTRLVDDESEYTLFMGGKEITFPDSEEAADYAYEQNRRAAARAAITAATEELVEGLAKVAPAVCAQICPRGEQNWPHDPICQRVTSLLSRYRDGGGK